MTSKPKPTWGTPRKGDRTFKDINNPPKNKDLPKGIDNLNIKNLENEFFKDVRKVPPSNFNNSVYDSLVNLILNHKMELKKMPSLMTPQGALDYAQKTVDSEGNKLYRYRGEDLNGDGEKDIILYNRAGKPVIINGYKAKPSDFGLINSYRQLHPTESSRKQTGGLKGWIKEKYGFEEGEHPWDENKIANEDVEEFDLLAQRGYRKIPKPQTKKSFNAIFAGVVKGAVKEWFKIFAEDNGYSPEISKLVSPLALYRLLFMVSQELPLSQQIKASDYEDYKAKIKKRKSTYEKHQDLFIEQAMKGNIDYNWVGNVMNMTYKDTPIIRMIIGDATFEDAKGDRYPISNDEFPQGWQNDSNITPALMKLKKAFFAGAKEQVSDNLRLYVIPSIRELFSQKPKVEEILSEDEEN